MLKHSVAITTATIIALAIPPASADHKSEHGIGSGGGEIKAQLDALQMQVDDLATTLESVDDLLDLMEQKTVFMTSSGVTGDFGGLEGGDAICQSHALNAGLPGVFFAWLSDSIESPGTRMTKSLGPYINTGGSTIASSYGDLTDGELHTGITLDEFGDPFPLPVVLPVWTGTAPWGGSSPSNCEDWTSASGASSGRTGGHVLTDSDWTSRTESDCDSLNRLYCIQQ